MGKGKWGDGREEERSKVEERSRMLDAKRKVSVPDQPPVERSSVKPPPASRPASQSARHHTPQASQQCRGHQPRAPNLFFSIVVGTVQSVGQSVSVRESQPHPSTPLRRKQKSQPRDSSSSGMPSSGQQAGCRSTFQCDSPSAVVPSALGRPADWLSLCFPASRSKSHQYTRARDKGSRIPSPEARHLFPVTGSHSLIAPATWQRHHQMTRHSLPCLSLIVINLYFVLMS